MAITSSGIGSNLDVNGIITQLMTLEKRPLTALSTKEAGYQAKISALGSLNGAISSLQSSASALVPSGTATPIQKFSTFKATVADTAVASATADSSAVAGTYSLEVTQLAQQHRIVTSATVSPFSGGTLTTGGTLSIRLDTQAGSTSPSRTTNVTIPDVSTPEAIRDAINGASAGVSATVVNGNTGKQLVLVSNFPGSKQFIKLSGIAALAYDPNATPAPLTNAFEQTQAAQGSAFKINGIASTAGSNTVSTVIDGITLTLTKKSEAGVSTTLTLLRDTSSLNTAVSAFVKAYNDMNTTATTLGGYNATTKVAGTLNGDSLVRSAQNAFRTLLGRIPTQLSSASLKTLSDIGVSLQKDGSLSLDSAKLNKAITNDLNAVANVVAAYGQAFKTAADGIVGTTGIIAARTDGLNTQIKALGKQSELLVARLTQVEARYRKQFTSLDTLMSNMTKTSNFLTQQLASLPSLN